MRRDHDAGPRRLRVMHVLITQAGIALILLALAWFSRADRQMLALYLATLLVPAGWAFALYTAWQRDEAARREGRATPEFFAAERKRATGILGVTVVVWVALALALVYLL